VDTEEDVHIAEQLLQAARANGAST
jgi:hypothetical protein